MARRTGLSQKMKRREFLGTLAVMGGAAALGTASPAAPTAAAATAVKRGGTLNWAETQEFNSFNPWGLNAANMIMQNVLYNRMVALGKDGKPQGHLAESWNLASDAKSMTIKLRPGLKWHDGKDFNADSIAAHLDYAKDPSMAKNFGVNRLAGLLPKGMAVETPDKLTVVLKFLQPTPAIFDILDYWYIGRIDDRSDPDSVKKLVSGTGPFKLVEWVTGSHSRYQRFDGFWNKGLPNLDGLVIKRLEKAETLAPNLRARAADIVAHMPVADTDLVRKDPNYEVLMNEGNGVHMHLMLNPKKPPFDKLKVRQALAHAINREEIIRTAWFGVGSPISSPWYSPVSLAYSPGLVKAYPYDLRQARKLLDEAGIKTLEINTFANTGWPEDKVTLQLLQADWANIGIKLNFSEVQTSQYYDRRFSGDFEFLLWFNARALRDPYIFLGTQSEITGHGVPYGITSAALDKLTQEGAAEVDPEKRRKIYQEANRIIVEELCTCLWYRTRPYIYGTAKYVKDWSWDLLGHNVFDNVWLDK